MTDIVSKKKRSEVMSRIKSKDSKIEILLRKKLWEQGLRYRKNSSKYFGKPDIIIQKYKIVIFVDSCFWHGCKKHCRIPSIRKKYWVNKISRNRVRDQEVIKYYKNQKWKVLRVWEHEILKDLEKLLIKVLKFLNENN